MTRDERFAASTLRALGAFIVWALHFGVLYGATGLACARGFAGALPWTIGIATAAALGACAFFLLSGMRSAGRDLLAWFTPAAAALAALAVLWQALPVAMVPPCA